MVGKAEQVFRVYSRKAICKLFIQIISWIANLQTNKKIRY